MNDVIYTTLLHLIMLIVCNYGLYTSPTFITKEFPNPHPIFGFTTMSKYGSDTIILGGTNYLYRLYMKNLEKEVETNIGPRLDNLNCLSLENDPCNKGMRPYNSYIKALLINNNKRLQQDEIIICTSLFQGSCGKRNVTTLELLPGYSDTSEDSKCVVANNGSATTVAFLAPGPSTNGTFSSTVMYVGASWTNTGPRAIRGLVPAFSSRKTENFSFTWVDVHTRSYRMTDEMNRDSFPIRYIFGFASGIYSYMGTIQKPNVGATNFISKLIRVCLFDKHFYSYAEAEIYCEFNGKKYNLLQTAKVSKPGRHLAATMSITEDDDVLFGMFGYGHPNDLIDNNKESAMCIYPIRRINQVFTLNIKTCFKGTGRTGPEHISSPRNCQPTVLIESHGIATEYDDITLDPGFPILKDMIFDKDKRYLYVLSPNKLVKMVVQNCSQYTTCKECKRSSDPYCGWCSMENKCSQAQECSDYDSALKWMAFGGETCTKITQVYPEKIQRDNNLAKTITISLNIYNLPTYMGSYKCAFHGNGKTIETAANRTSPNVVKCDTPVHNELPPFPIDTDYITIRISIVVMELDFVSTNFTLFDCKVHSNCYRCTSSSFNCTWCIKNHLCTHYPGVDCSTNDDFIAGQNSAGMTVTHDSGPNSCPSLEQIRRQNLLVPSGTNKIISLSLKKLKPYQKPIRCVFVFNSQTEYKGEIANIVDMGVVMIVKCKQTRFFYPGDSESYNIPLKILWGETYPKELDNPYNAQVIMYKCENMASSCGECLTQNEAYSCGWCKPSNQCSIQSTCTTTDGWLPNTENCPNPRIKRFYPLFGPKQGGTLLTIDGINLGKSYEDIVSNISIAGVQCSPIRKEYVESKQIVCTTGTYYGQEEKKSGQVLVTVALTLSAKSEEKFTYVDPEITDITPTQGPKSGGTKIIIFGKYLNAGTIRKTFFGNETFECKIIEERTFSSNLTCVTAPSNRTFTTDPLYMDIDYQRVKSYFSISYVADPIVTEVSRLTSFVSGGLRVLVRGNGFIPISNSLTSPKMVFYKIGLNHTITSYYGECLVLNDITMECSTPQVEPSMVTKRLNTPDESGVAFGFVIDNVQDIRNVSATHGVFFKICVDPGISVFPNDKIKPYLQKSNEYLTISGTNLDQIRLELDDVMIKIGKSECYVTSTGRQLTCRPPKEQPIPVKSRLYPEVEVTIGKNLNFFLGFLKYEETYLATPVESITKLSFSLYMYFARMLIFCKLKLALELMANYV